MTTEIKKPMITGGEEFGGYFKVLVQGWIDQKTTTFNHHAINITAGPYRFCAVSYESKDGVLTLDFYSLLRHGFGGLSKKEAEELIELL